MPQDAKTAFPPPASYFRRFPRRRPIWPPGLRARGTRNPFAKTAENPLGFDLSETDSELATG